MSIFAHYQDRFEEAQQEEYTLQEYLNLCKDDPTAYASASERMLRAIGEPELVDTAKDPRLSRIFRFGTTPFSIPSMMRVWSAMALCSSSCSLTPAWLCNPTSTHPILTA